MACAERVDATDSRLGEANGWLHLHRIQTVIMDPLATKLDRFFLPDLCNSRALVLSLAVSVGLVLALTLLETGVSSFSWQRFAIVSFFVQWVVLLSFAGLCTGRRWLAHWPALWASVMAMVWVALVTAMVSVSGELLWPEPRAGIDWLWVIRNVLVASIFAAMALRYFYVQSQWRWQSQAQLQARLAALQAHIRPHFFFNTLNTVASLIPVDADKAEQMLLDLAQLFRRVLQDDDQPVTLRHEVELARRYLAIEQTRLGQRLQVQWRLPAALPEVQVPSLILQPLLENAVYHGIQPVLAAGYITVDAYQDGGYYVLRIRNSKPASAAVVEGHQMAQENVRARLAMMPHGAGALLCEQNDREYSVCIRLPYTEDGQ